MQFLKLRTVLIPALLAAFFSTSPQAKALMPEKEDYDEALIGTWVDEAQTVKRVGYDHELGEYLYRVTDKYYEQFSYTWTDKNNVTHTSKLTDRATENEQMFALLAYVYSNPEIPGYRRDVAFEKYKEEEKAYFLNEDGNMNNGAGKIFETEGSNVVLYDGVPRYAQYVEMSRRADFATVPYPDHNFYPYFVKDVKAPLNGATALLVEMEDKYYPYTYENGVVTGFNTSDACGRYDKYKTRQEFFAAIFDNVKAITVISTQFYVDETTSPTNPGFIFNIDASLSKCFLITKGCTRGQKFFQRLGAGRVATEFYSGEPFYQMFEEFSPSNGGPKLNSFAMMNAGEQFPIDHNCGTNIQQQHDIIFAPTETDYSYYNINLMMFVPDRRFDWTTLARKDHQSLTDPFTGTPLPYNADVTGKEKTFVSVYDFNYSNNSYTPYSFYAPDHQPYIYFNKIQAHIEKPTIPEQTGEGEINPILADVPINWASQYNKIVGHRALEAFKVYRVVNGNAENHAIPLDEIEVDYERTNAPLIEEGFVIDDPENKGYTYVDEEKGIIYSYADEVYVKIKEIAEFRDLKRYGNEVSYIISGKRSGNEAFTDVLSNIVIAHLPGNHITIDLVRAESKSDFTHVGNNYVNTFNIFYNGYDDTHDPKDNAEGNLTIDDLIELPADKSLGDVKPSELKLKNVELRIYRIKMLETPEYYHIRTFKPAAEGNGISYVVWGGDKTTADKNPEFSTLVVTFDQYTPDGKLVKFDADKEEITHFSQFKVKRNFSDIVSGDNLNAMPWKHIGGSQQSDDIRRGIFATIVDEFPSQYANYDQLSQRFRYIACLVSTSDTPEGAADDENSKIIAEIEKSLKASNFANVYVPKRQILAGFVPYSQAEVDADREFIGGLPENDYAIAVNVLNNQNVSGYDIYSLKTRKKMARIDRFTDGHFEPALYGDDEKTLIPQRENNSTNNYNGKVVINLPEGYGEGDEFAAEIQYYHEGLYSGNTYVMPRVTVPARPALTITDFQLSGDTPELSGDRYSFSGDLYVGIENADVFGDHDYRVWSQEAGTPRNDIDLVYNPRWDNDYAVLAAESESTDDGGVQSLIKVSFQHTNKPEGDKFIMFNKHVRLYAKLTDDYKIVKREKEDEFNLPNSMVDEPAVMLLAAEASENSDEDGYYVVDSTRLFGVYADGGLSGIEDVSADAVEVEYYNLQGVRVNADALAPGIYIRRQGDKTQKIAVQ